MNTELCAVLEGLLFVVGEDGLTLTQIESILELEEKDAQELITFLMNKYEEENRGLRITYLGNAYKFTTRKEHKKYYQRLIENPETSVLSQAALETLAIIAYNEPVCIQQIDEIRGVGSREMVKRLVAKGFVKEIGKSDLPGKPLIYATTKEFLDYFGLSSKENLPKLKPALKEPEEDEIDLYHSKYQEENQ